MKKEVRDTLDEFTRIKVGKIFITLKSGQTLEFKQNLFSIKLTEDGLVIKEYSTSSSTTFIEYNEIRNISRQLLG